MGQVYACVSQACARVSSVCMFASSVSSVSQVGTKFLASVTHVFKVCVKCLSSV